MRERESSGDIDGAAAEWTARLDRGALSEDEKQALDLWLQADVRRQGALARAMAISAAFDELDGPMQSRADTCGARGPRG